MTTTTDKQLADWLAGTKLMGFRRRNWPVMRRLGAVTAALLLVSLPAEFALGSHDMAAACWIGAAATGAEMFAWLFDRRLFVA